MVSSQPPVVFGHLADPLAGFPPDLVLPLGLVGHRPFHGAKTIQVLDLDERRGLSNAACRRVDVQVDVSVNPQAAFLHVAVGDTEVIQQQFQLGEIRLGLFGRPQIGLADDFQQRRAGSIQIDAAVGPATGFVVHTLAGVFLEMGTEDADLPLDSGPIGTDFVWRSDLPAPSISSQPS